MSLLWCSLFHRAYYRKFKVVGRENIPKDSPVIFASSHQNALMDPLAVIFAARRQIVFLARADIFRKKPIAAFLRFIRILPVYRIRDGYNALSQNRETFDEVNQVLKKNIPIGIFPEGSHLAQKELRPLRKGIARIAFQAEEDSDFQLGLRIVPVGLDYSNYHKAGSDLVVTFGKPLTVADYKEHYKANAATGINCLMDDLAEAMRDTLAGTPSLPGEMESLSKPVFKRFLRSAVRILLFPLAFYGAVVNFIPISFAALMTGRIKDPHFISSVRFGAGFVFINIWFLILDIAIILLVHNPFIILVLVFTLPIASLVSISYSSHCRS